MSVILGVSFTPLSHIISFILTYLFIMSCCGVAENILSLLSKDDVTLCESMCECGQKNMDYSNDKEVTNFLSDVKSVAVTYPGGVSKYIESASKLITDATQNVNPFDGFKTEVPDGENLEYNKGSFHEIEKLGKEMLKHCAFALVGGGIGERLNSQYIKLSLTSDLVRGYSYLEDYCSFFHAIETEMNCEVPFAVMTSDGTNDETISLLEKHNYFGLKKENVTVMKQNGVPAIKNVLCEIAVKDDGHIIFKPHGHGDIHLLMNQFNLPDAWRRKGIKYVIFFQDTNGLSLHGFAPLLGVTERCGFDFNSMTIIRRPGEKVGGICRLVKDNGETLTCNVEYNQLESVLIASTGKGDVANSHGDSDYPGNINLLCIRLDNYHQILKESGGVVQEFVNPKFKDATRTEFLAPVRLECMMQDYPKLLMKYKSPVGFVSLPRWMCFSAVKNSDENAVKQFATTGYPESFFSGEEDIYKFYRRILRSVGVTVGDEAYDADLTAAIGFPRFPLVTLSSRSGLITSDITRHFGKNVTITDRAVLRVDGEDVFFENVIIDGALTVKACKGAKVVIHDFTIKNESWYVKKVDKNDPSIENKFALRGYMLVKKETRELVFEEAGEFDITM